MDQRNIPHEHSCVVCKVLIGCEEKYCQIADWTVCQRPACIAAYSQRVVHRQADYGSPLPCCGVLTYQTPPGDTMTSDPGLVTCRGRLSLVNTELPGSEIVLDHA